MKRNPAIVSTKNIASILVSIGIVVALVMILQLVLNPGVQLKRYDVMSYLKQISLSDDSLALMNDFNKGPQRERATYSMVKVEGPSKRILWRAEYIWIQPKSLFSSSYKNHVICEVEDKSNRVACYIDRLKND